MSEVVKGLHENIDRTRSGVYWKAGVENTPELDETRNLLADLEKNPENYLAGQHEIRWHEVMSAVWLARTECYTLSSVWWRYYFEELPAVRRAIYRWQYPERKEKHFYPPYLGGQEIKEAVPEEASQIPEVNDHLIWHKEMRDILQRAMSVWDIAERLLITLALADEQPDETVPAGGEMSQRERVLARVRDRLQPMFTREMQKLLSELFDPSVALEQYASAYIDFKHLFHAYSTDLCIDTVWGWTTDWDQFSVRSVVPYENKDKFIRASVRLSETKMRLVRQAEIYPNLLDQAKLSKLETDDRFRQDEDLFLDQLF